MEKSPEPRDQEATLQLDEPLIKPERPRAKSHYGRRYQRDPEFKKRILNYLAIKQECEICGAKVGRANFARHRQSKKHIKAVEAELNK